MVTESHAGRRPQLGAGLRSWAGAGRAEQASAGAPIRGVVALAAVSDLTACADEGLGGGAAAALMGGSPAAEPDRYARADPARLLPIGVPVWLLHGTETTGCPRR
jgi:pimeloyl-ACP methyl ester carboxylesterase